MTDLSHKESLEAFDNDWRADQSNRDDAQEDLRFKAGFQWDDIDRAKRAADSRPVLTINRIPQFIRRVSGNLRQSHPAIEAIPSDDQSDGQLADIYEGLIRQIEYQSTASSVYAWGAECAISCGIGHWRIDTEYANRAGFDQNIVIKRIMDPLAVVWDASSKELDRSDAWQCFVTEWVGDTEGQRRWPKTWSKGTNSDFPVMDTLQGTGGLYWRNDKRTRVASRWFKEAVTKQIGMTEDGSVFDLTDLAKRSGMTVKFMAQMLGIVRDRKVDDFKVRHVAMNGDDFLTDIQEWAGAHIPIVPVIGEEVAFDGTVFRHGVVRFAKDPQRLYNFYRSAAAEAIGSAPKSPWLLAAKSVAGHEKTWSQANAGNPAYLLYNPLTDFPSLKPERVQPPSPPSAMWQEAEVAQDDMKATTGVYDAALGAQGTETSGIAIQRRNQQTDTGSVVYFDNFNVSIKRTGTVLIDLIPKIYDAERVVRILGKDAKEGFVKINQVVTSVDGRETLINDLSTGTYDVRVKTGQSYANAKAEAKEELGNLMREDPAVAAGFIDLYVGSLDLPPEIGKPMVERAKRMVPPQLLSDAQPPPPPDPRIAALKDVALAKADADLSVARATADKLTLQNEQLAELLGLHPGAEAPRELNPVVVGQGGQPGAGSAPAGALAPQPARQPQPAMPVR